MKRFGIFTSVCLLCMSSAFAAGTKTYQVMGPVLDMKDNVIVVQEGKVKWKIARDANTRVTGVVKLGAKVAEMYRMSADSIEVKEGRKI
jgi:hypothetical protein